MGIVILWLRGLIYTIAGLIVLAVVFGTITFISAKPEIGLPLLVLVVAPLILGVATEKGGT